MPSSPRLEGPALASGGLLAAASLPGPFGPLALVALVPLFRLLFQQPTPKRAGYAGFVAGLVFMSVANGWVLASSARVGPALAIGFAIGLPVFAAGIGACMAMLACVAQRAPLRALAAAPGVWVALEYARSQEWLVAIPWTALGYSLGDHAALAQGAAWAGVYGLSFWVVATNAFVAAAPRLGVAARAACVVLLAAPLAPGAALLAAPRAPVHTVRVAAVQPHWSDAERADPERFGANLAVLVALSRSALDGSDASSRSAVQTPADLIAWPESVYRRVQTDASDAFLRALAHDLGAPLLTGAPRAPGAGHGWRNVAVLEPGDGGARGVAEKAHPVTVFERAPEGPIARALAKAGFWSGSIERGGRGAPLPLRRARGSAVACGVLVCFDASFPEVARELRRSGADVLVAIANEAETGVWSAHLHARATRMRAIENGIAIVRVANTGPSLWIDARGRVVASLAAGSRASGVHAVEVAGAPPPWVAFGDVPVVLAALATAAAASLIAPRRRVPITDLAIPSGASTT
jgi:apolipoprotein N-acyltransferase